VDYRLPKTMLKGLWLRIRRVFVQAAQEPEASNKWRIILNWEIRRSKFAAPAEI